MTGWNLPPGCTQADIDRAFGGDEECYHEEFEITLEGRATCDRCGESWWASDDEIRHFRELNALADAHWRKEERRERWRQRWELIARPCRWFLYRVLERIAPRQATRVLRDDEIPF